MLPDSEGCYSAALRDRIIARQRIQPHLPFRGTSVRSEPHVFMCTYQIGEETFGVTAAAESPTGGWLRASRNQRLQQIGRLCTGIPPLAR